jgi:CheY-like chemotaxis protein
MNITEKKIMLIDDNKLDNYYNQKVLNRFDPELKLVVHDSAQEALDDLLANNKEFPDYIFLDINMPGVNGWDFINIYIEKMIPNGKVTNLVLLTTSENPEDMEKAKSLKVVNSYISKPLNQEILKTLIG